MTFSVPRSRTNRPYAVRLGSSPAARFSSISMNDSLGRWVVRSLGADRPNDLSTQRPNHLLQRGQQQRDVSAARRFAHRTDSPELAFERPQSAADLYSV